MLEDDINVNGVSQPESVDAVVTSRTLRRDSRKGYGDFISSLVADQPAWLVTITHAKLTTHPEFSIRARRRWLNDVNTEIFGSRYLRRGEGVMAFFGLEYQKRGTVHQHGVLAGQGLTAVSRRQQSSGLSSHAMGFCKIELPRDSVKAVRYCAKYVSKEGELDIWLPGYLLTRLSIAPGLVSGFGRVTPIGHERDASLT